MERQYAVVLGKYLGEKLALEARRRNMTLTSMVKLILDRWLESNRPNDWASPLKKIGRSK